VSDRLHEWHGKRVLEIATEGSRLEGERDALDLIGAAYGHHPDWIALPVARCSDAFFALRTRVLGDVVQKLVNYGLHVAIVGDVSAWVAASDALRDFVREANRGGQVWFVADLGELAQRLAPRA
jgi:hypothetical protein